jgi:hypothetical protein
MDLQSDMLAWAALAWLILSILVTIATWWLASKRVESPGWVTVSNAALCFFTPINLLVLAYVATLDKRREDKTVAAPLNPH